MRLGSWLLDIVLIVVTLVIGWLIWGATIGGAGQTPAKRLLKLRVISSDTMRPIGLGQMFWMRGLLASWLAQIAFVFTLGVLVFMPFWDKRNQNVWDKVSSTYVVNDPTDRWGTKPTHTPVEADEAADARIAQPTAVSQPTVPAGWHADPSERHELRYWDGSQWTENVSDEGQASIDAV